MRGLSCNHPPRLNSVISGGRQGGRNLGVMGVGSVRETGEEWSGDGIPNRSGAGRKRK